MITGSPLAAPICSEQYGFFPDLSAALRDSSIASSVPLSIGLIQDWRKAGQDTAKIVSEPFISYNAVAERDVPANDLTSLPRPIAPPSVMASSMTQALTYSISAHDAEKQSDRYRYVIISHCPSRSANTDGGFDGIIARDIKNIIYLSIH